MDSNGHGVAATWRPEDFADLETLAAPLAVNIFESKKPPIVIDPRGYEMLVFCGDVGNPLIADAVAAYEEQNRRATQVQTTTDALDRAPEIRDLHDKVLAAICLQPRYCPKAKLMQGRPPPGQLWYGSFTADQRRNLVNFFYVGADALKSLPAAALPPEPAPRRSERLAPAAEHDPDSAGAAVSPVVARRGDSPLAERAGHGGATGAERTAEYS